MLVAIEEQRHVHIDVAGALLECAHVSRVEAGGHDAPDPHWFDFKRVRKAPARRETGRLASVVRAVVAARLRHVQVVLRRDVVAAEKAATGSSHKQSKL